jgi:hypothetical protein
MKSANESGIAALGLATAIGSYASSLLGLLNDPLYVFAALFAAVCVSLWNWYSAETQQVESVGLTPSVALRCSPSQRRNARRIAVAALCLGITVLVLDGFSFLNLVRVQSVIQRRQFFNEHAETVDDDVPLQLCNRIQNQSDLVYVALQALDTFSITITKQNRIPYLQIETIDLVVDQFTPELPIPSSPGDGNAERRPPLVYLAHIDSSVGDGVRVFPSRYLELETETLDVTTGNVVSTLIETSPIVLIDDNKPTRIIVKVNSEVGGLCSYHLRVKFRYLWQVQTWTSEPRTTRFVQEKSEQKIHSGTAGRPPT